MKISHDYSGRMRRLQTLLKSTKLDGIYVANVTSLLYFTGLALSVGKLLIAQKRATLFVDSRYREYAENTAALSVKNLDVSALRKALSTWKRIAFEGSDMSYTEGIELKKMIPNGATITSVMYSKELRSIKEASEIECLRQSASLLWEGFLHLQSRLRVGITEKELDKEFRKFCIDHDASVAFDPIIAFGANSSKPHHKSGATPLQKGTVVLIDIGLHFHSYASDMTRMVFFGDVDPKWRRLHDIVAEAKREAMKFCKSGTIIRELDLAARAVFRKENLESHFVHSLGHGVGLDVHEWPVIHSKGTFAALPLKENMVITIEPGLYFPGEGGIRMEDTIQITKSGYHNFFSEH